MNEHLLAECGHVRTRRCRHGVFIFNKNDIYVGQSLDLYGEYSELEADLFSQIVRPGNVVVDVGANIGLHTVQFAQAAGPSGLVIAFEPQQALFHMLCGNVAINGLTNVVAHQIGVGASEGILTVPPLDYSHRNNFGGVSLASMGEGSKVPVITIDSFGLEVCDFIKVDVEGMELDVLNGAVETLGRCKPILYVENDRREKSPALISRLNDLGYKLYWHLPPLYNQANFYGNQENVFPRVVSINVLCIHRDLTLKMEDFVPVRTPEDWPPVQ